MISQSSARRTLRPFRILIPATSGFRLQWFRLLGGFRGVSESTCQVCTAYAGFLCDVSSFVVNPKISVDIICTPKYVGQPETLRQ
jgi:hypothetical protein